jgi:hypothetical protein
MRAQCIASARPEFCWHNSDSRVPLAASVWAGVGGRATVTGTANPNQTAAGRDWTGNRLGAAAGGPGPRLHPQLGGRHRGRGGRRGTVTIGRSLSLWPRRAGPGPGLSEAQ